MSAIAGIVAFDGRPVDPASIESLLASLAHRGSPGVRSLDDGSATFFLFRNSRSAGEQPGPIRIAPHLLLTADVRIDNREEFRSLAPSGDHAGGDIALAAEIWRRAGSEGLARIAGDFTMAIWDGDTRRLVCARDHIGVRPLYYHATPGRLIFSTELEALLELPELSATVDEGMIAAYLGSMPRPPESTYYHEIKRLPPAHVLIAEPGGIAVRRYWQLDPDRAIGFGSQGEYDEAFRAQFVAAVACRFDGGARTGSMLSGGLDSSSISAVARSLAAERGERLQTFSIIFPSYPLCDETPWISSLVERGDIDPTYIEGDRIGPLSGLEEMLDHLHEPLDAPNLFLHDAMYRRAHELGLDSILDGLDGDTTVSHGVAYLAELASAGRFGALWQEVTQLAVNEGKGRHGILWRRALKPLVPGMIRGLKQRWPSSAESTGTIVPNPEFARRTGYRAMVREQFEQNLEAPLNARRHHHRKLTSTLIPEVLEIADLSAGRYGMEPRYPFFDRRLVEFCLALPGDQKLHAGWTRFILRNALGGILPEKIRWRRGKANLGHNFVPSLLRHESRALESMIRSPGELASYIDIVSLGSAYARYRSAPSNADASILWKALALHHWLEGRRGRSNRT